jgi:ABC-type glycerol-3-phosphate transport system permease component
MANPTTSISAGKVRAAEQPQVVTVPPRPYINFPVFKIIVYAVLTLGALLFVMPFIWMLSTSLMTSSEIAQGKYITGNSLYGFHSISGTNWDRHLEEYLPPKTELSFRGTSASVNYIAHSDGGVFDISIDGQLIGSVDTYSENVENRAFLVDSYPEVPTLSLTQSVGLADSRHELSIIYNEQQSRGNSLWFTSVDTENADGETDTIFTDNFDRINGVWQAVNAEDGRDLTFNEETEAWELPGGASVAPEEIVQRVDNIGFPSYLESCCRALIARSTRLQGQPLSEFIRLERPSGTHSSFTTSFLPGFVVDLFGLSDRYVVTGSFSHYVRVWTTENFSEFFINSVIITGLTVVIQTLFSILAAYAFARIEFPGRNVMFAIFLTTLFVPTMVVLVPNLLTVTSIDKWSFNHIGPILDDIGDFTGRIPLIGRPKAEQAKWLDNWPSLVIPFTASTFSIFLLRQFFMQIPNELWDAAQIDGAGHVLFLFRIVVPISRAAITTIVLFTFIGTWDALEWAILVTTRNDWRPISYALYNFRTDEGNYPQLLMAGALITLFPVILVYLIAQKQFTEGIATTGLKG